MTHPKDSNKFMGTPDATDENFKHQITAYSFSQKEEMTNAERAKAIADKLYYDVEGLQVGSDPILHQDNLSITEQALDEKDAEWKKHADARELLGFEKGQREMRERAAKWCGSCWQPGIKDCQCPGCVFGKTIRALPIEEE